MKAIGYCEKCCKPFAWHKNELDFSRSLGVRVIGECVYTDDSRPGWWWGLATQKPAREYLTGERMSHEQCGFINPMFPGLPCLKKRGHDESEDPEQRVHAAPLENFPLEYVLRFVQRPARNPDTGLEVEVIRRKTREGVRAGLYDHEGKPAYIQCEHCGGQMLVIKNRCDTCQHEREGATCQR